MSGPLLAEVDRVIADDSTDLGDVLLWAALLVEPLLEACDQTSDPRRAARDFLEPVIERLNLPRRIAESVERIVAILPRIEAGPGQRQQKSALYPAGPSPGRLTLGGARRHTATRQCP